MDVAAVEAGLGGRFDATNVLDAPVVVLTNVALEHTDVLGDTRGQIAAEKLAVVRPGATVVLGEPEWEGLARDERRRARHPRDRRQHRARRGRLVGLPRPARRARARAAARSARMARGRALGRRTHARGRPLHRAAPSRARGDRRFDPLRQGRRWDPAPALHHAPAFVATTSSHPRALRGRGARTARPASSGTSRRRGFRPGGGAGAQLGTPVLVTGSLYLLNGPRCPSARRAVA